jgi:hypothetical protein
MNTMTPTKFAELIILGLATQARGPISLKEDITPIFRNTRFPHTFAIWNLVKQGRILRIGVGQYELQE